MMVIIIGFIVYFFGFLVFLDNLKYYLKYIKLFYIYFLRKINGKILYMCVFNICLVIREFLIYI